MNALKSKNMLRAYTGHRGTATLAAIKGHVPSKLFARLTGKELGLVLNAVNVAYHAGKSSLGGVDLCDDCLWLPGTGVDGALVPLAALNAITISIRDTGGTDYDMHYFEPKPF